MKVFVLCRISEMYVANESQTDGKIPVRIDVVFPKMQCICKLAVSSFDFLVIGVTSFRLSKSMDAITFLQLNIDIEIFRLWAVSLRCVAA